MRSTAGTWEILQFAVAELVAIAFTPLGVAGLFAATFGFFFGGVLVGFAALMEDVRALRATAERALPR